MEITLKDDDERGRVVEEIIEEELKPLHLSLNAIEGTVGISSIRLIGKVNGNQVGFLVDTDATHNFVDSKIVVKLQLKVEDIAPFSVTVAGGEKFQGGGYCRKVVLYIQGQRSEADLLIVPLGEPQIILGMVWLKSLEPTIWNFSEHTLKYWKENQCYFKGCKPQPRMWLTGNYLIKCLLIGC